MPEQQTSAYALLNANGLGDIEPAPRIKAGEITETDVEAFVDALDSDEFYDEITDFMPACCVDGRHRQDGECRLGANAAGGAFSLVAADMLTTQTFKLDAQTTAQYAEGFFSYLNSVYPGKYGGHDADQVKNPEANSGCGAVDRMSDVIALIADHGDALHAAATSLGMDITQDDMDVIAARAQQIKQQQGLAVSNGKEMMSKLKDATGDGVETLTGKHNEVVVMVNDREGTTLNRAKIRARYGDTLQAFNYDRWAMRKAVHAISQNVEQDEARLKLAAADIYNLAVACTLAGPSLRVAKRGEYALAS